MGKGEKIMKDYNDNDIVEVNDMNGGNDLEMRTNFPLLDSDFLDSDRMKNSALKNWIEIDNVLYELRKCEKWKCEKCTPSPNGLTVDSNENISYYHDKCDLEKDEIIAATAVDCENDVEETTFESSSNITGNDVIPHEGNGAETSTDLRSVCNCLDASKHDLKTTCKTICVSCNSNALELNEEKQNTRINVVKSALEAGLDGVLDNQQSNIPSSLKEFETTKDDIKCIEIIESIPVDRNISDSTVLDRDNTAITDDLMLDINNPNLFSDFEDSDDDDVFQIETRTTATLPQCANYFRTRTKRSCQTQSESAILDNVGGKIDKPHHLTVSDSAIISALSKRTDKCADSGARKKSVHFAIFPYVIEIPRVSDLEKEFLDSEREIYGN